MMKTRQDGSVCFSLRLSLVLGVALGSVGILHGQVVIDDPIAYWSFSDADILSNQVISSPFHDAAVLRGQPVSGVYEGAPGLVGNALVLDGESGLRLPYHQDMLGPSFSISVWYWQATNDTRMTIYQTANNWNMSCESLDPATTTFRHYLGQGTACDTTTPLGQWIHLAHVFTTAANTTTLSVYTNGVFVKSHNVNSNTVFNTYRNRALHIGANRDSGRRLKGMIDELALWDRPLSDDEVTALYQRGLAGEPLAVSSSQPSWRINLEGKHRYYAVTNTWPTSAGVYQSGWLLDAGNTVFHSEPIMYDTAARLDDTAGHPSGPFHAETTTSSRVRMSLTEEGLGQVTQGDFTIEARFFTRETGRGVLFGNYQVGSTIRALNIEINNNAVRLFVQPSISGRSTVNLQLTPTGVTLMDGQWHHLAGTRSGSLVTLWLDGVPLGTANDTAGSFTLSGPYFYLRGDSRTDTTLFNGDVEDARLWTRCLSTNEIENLAVGVRPGGAEVSRDALLAEYISTYTPHTASLAPPSQKYRTPLVPPLSRITQGDFTLETWFRTTNARRGTILGNYFNNANQCVNLELAANNQVRFYVQKNSSTINNNFFAAGPTTRDGNWHHLAGLRRGGQLYIFLDGQQVATQADVTGAFDLSGDHYYFGRDARTTYTDIDFDGDFKNARIWSRALENSELSALAAGELPGSPSVAIDNMLVEYTCYRPTNNLHTAGFTSERFFRTCSSGTNTLSLVFEGLPRHATISLGAFVAQLESTDPVRDNDVFLIRVDGSEVLKAGLGFGQALADYQPEVASLSLFGVPADPALFAETLTLGGENLFCGDPQSENYHEHVYDLSQLEALQAIPHSGDTLQIDFIGVHNQAFETEGFGVDRIHVNLPPVKGTIFHLR